MGKRVITAITAGLICFAYGEVRFNQGYSTGADSALCMVALFKSEDSRVTPDECKGIWINPVTMRIRAAYISAIGQEIPSRRNPDGTYTLGAE